MNKILISTISFLLILAPQAFAELQHRGATELLPETSQAIEVQYQTFSKILSWDDQGAELTPTSGNSYRVSDIWAKYARGIAPEIEASLSTNFRSIKSETISTSKSKSGLETLKAEAKYSTLIDKKYNNAVRFHLNKSLYVNPIYSNNNPPPAETLVLGDDGFGYGVDYLVTVFNKRFKYDLSIGYNKPSASLSSELPYNAEAIYSFKKIFLLAGIGGIFSLKTDEHTITPTLKPIISNTDSRLFNSINREKKYLYAGAEYSMNNYILALKTETIFSGQSTDKGNTISINLRFEDGNIKPLLASKLDQTALQKYFASGAVTAVSSSGNAVKINIGTNLKIEKATKIDIFSSNLADQSRPMANGYVIEVGKDWAKIIINKRLDQLPIQVDYLIKAY